MYTKYRGNYRHRCLKRWSKKCCVPGCLELRIQIHHIDGDSENCESVNLVPLCHTHHWNVHVRKRMTVDQLMKKFLELLPKECRIKIAEKIGDPRLITLAIRGEG